METFTLTANSGWQLLATLLAAAGYTGHYQWNEFQIKNTHGANTIQVKNNPENTAPAVNGWGLAINGGSLVVTSGPFNGRNIWLNPSGASTTFDVAFVRSQG